MRKLKIYVRKNGEMWQVSVIGPILTEVYQYPHFTDALARVQIELDPRMSAECDRKAKLDGRRTPQPGA